MIAADKQRPAIVWPYIARQAEGQELRLSVRSVLNFLAGDRPRLVLVGDVPPWWPGEHLPLAPIARRPGRHFARFDRAAKLAAIANHPHAPRRFLWWQDDLILTRPTTYEQIAEPRHRGPIYAADLADEMPTPWEETKRGTLRYLHEIDPAREAYHDFAAHVPIEYEAEKAGDMIAEHDMLRRPLVDDLFYGNLYHLAGRHVGADLFTIDNAADLADLAAGDEPDGRRLFCNVAHGLFAPARDALYKVIQRPAG